MKDMRKGLKNCNECLEMLKDYQRERREAFKRLNICTACNQDLPKIKRKILVKKLADTLVI